MWWAPTYREAADSGGLIAIRAMMLGAGASDRAQVVCCARAEPTTGHVELVVQGSVSRPTSAPRQKRQRALVHLTRNAPRDPVLLSRLTGVRP